MASKTDVLARKQDKQREKFYGSCGDEVRPVRYGKRMAWYCEKHGTYEKGWVKRG